MRLKKLSIVVLCLSLGGCSIFGPPKEIPPLPAIYKTSCGSPEPLPEPTTEQPNDMGDVLNVAAVNALNLVQCEAKRKGFVVWFEEMRAK